jgi:FkbM family methyltransferase
MFSNLFQVRARKLWLCLLNPASISFLLKGCLPSFEHYSIASKNIIKEIDVFYDVGANIGQFSSFLHCIGVKTQIVAFEPLPLAYAKLNRLKAWIPNLDTYNVGLGSHKHSSRIHQTFPADSSSLFSTSVLQRSYFGTKDTETMLDVSIQTLADYVKLHPSRAGFLKIDVQGYELHVLKGLQDLSTYFKYIYVELSFVELYVGQPLFADIFKFLDVKSYRLVLIDNLSISKRNQLLQGDFLFERLPITTR